MQYLHLNHKPHIYSVFRRIKHSGALHFVYIVVTVTENESIAMHRQIPYDKPFLQVAAVDSIMSEIHDIKHSICNT